MPSLPATNSLLWFELPRSWVEPLIRYFRLRNTALDIAFYDVETLVRALRKHGVFVVTEPGPDEIRAAEQPAMKTVRLDLDALANPEGSILVVDAAGPTYVTAFDSVPTFLQHAKGCKPAIRTVSVTGVGSSALGAAAFAWNISSALRQPVAAIVPGYGMADVVQQALGGWFGFGLYNFWVKELTQNVLARTAPSIAHIGRGLMKTVPSHQEIHGVPVLRRGSGSSDVLHDILQGLPSIDRALGHSKGALVIKNAIADLPADVTARLNVLTFGCPIDETAPTVAHYEKFLGNLDVLGWLNAWGNRPEIQVVAHHSTNTSIPLSMRITELLGTPDAGIDPGIH